MAAFGVQLLKRGLALCGKNFGGFVEAWNHVVQRSANICGDADANPADGRISVDNTNPDHPVIRFDASNLGSSGSSGSDALPSAFMATPNYDDDGELKSWTFSNFFMMKGGRTLTSDLTAEYTTDALAGQYVCVSVGLSYIDDFYLVVVPKDSLDEYQKSESSYYIPIYFSPSKGELIDLRTMPQAQVFELGLTSDQEES